MRNNIVEPERPQKTIWRMRITRCYKLSEYVISLLVQLLHKSASVLVYTYIACIFNLKSIIFNADVTNYSTARGLHHVRC